MSHPRRRRLASGRSGCRSSPRLGSSTDSRLSAPPAATTTRAASGRTSRSAVRRIAIGADALDRGDTGNGAEPLGEIGAVGSVRLDLDHESGAEHLPRQIPAPSPCSTMRPLWNRATRSQMRWT